MRHRFVGFMPDGYITLAAAPDAAGSTSDGLTSKILAAIDTACDRGELKIARELLALCIAAFAREAPGQDWRSDAAMAAASDKLHRLADSENAGADATDLPRR